MLFVKENEAKSETNLQHVQAKTIWVELQKERALRCCRRVFIAKLCILRSFPSPVLKINFLKENDKKSTLMQKFMPVLFLTGGKIASCFVFTTEASSELMRKTLCCKAKFPGNVFRAIYLWTPSNLSAQLLSISHQITTKFFETKQRKQEKNAPWCVYDIQTWNGIKCQ